MKVTLIPERCIACGLCQTYSDVFDYHDNGIVKFYQTDELSLDLDSDPGLIQAIKECPTKAIEH
ncbi:MULTISPECIES: ferredoxin [unclassified Streptococcus]|uniref:ferredoxin n=1 Tax=unclassified Streptococcus TaxID=2608887 RepID=UPI0018A9692E|nr:MULTISPECIES: ferredoxin [unclassified Streptococcus]MBF8970885.1 ferredoxin [Streptococcus sp. NLN76]MBG9367038.1 ferredoxin [Streptococcus sp. NLN64]MBJ6745464.1 ferredoxin [Streptococcus sp. 121]